MAKKRPNISLKKRNILLNLRPEREKKSYLDEEGQVQMRFFPKRRKGESGDWGLSWSI